MQSLCLALAAKTRSSVTTLCRVGDAVSAMQACATMALIATVRDPDGRLVELTDERWEHILDRHRELRTLQSEIMHAVTSPTLIRAGRKPNERWYFLADTGPSRWLQAVVAYRDGRWFIASAFPRRRLP